MISKKKAGFRDAKEEWQYLKGQFKTFLLETPQQGFTWDRIKREVDYFEKHCSLEQCLQVYKECLLQKERLAVYSVFCQNHKPEQGNELSLDAHNKSIAGEVISTNFYNSYLP